MKMRHIDYYEWYINSCNRCQTCILGEDGSGAFCPAVDEYGLFSFSGGGKSRLGLTIIGNQIKNYAEIVPLAYECTFCGFCAAACPVTIDLYNLITDIREVIHKKDLAPDSAKKIINNIVEKDSLSGKKKTFTPPKGVKILPEEKAEVLFFTGCQARTDKDAKESANAALEILLKAGIDVGILKDEPCCGSPLLETGDYKDFKQQERKVKKAIKESKVSEIIIHCPHGYSTFLLSYDLSDDFPEIYLFTDYLNNLLEDDLIKLKNSGKDNFTFQDPCRVSHYLDESDTYRTLFSKLSKNNLVEIERHGKESYCCGNPYTTKEIDNKLYKNTQKIRKNEIKETGAKTLVTACPGCNHSLKDKNFNTVDLPVFINKLIK